MFGLRSVILMISWIQVLLLSKHFSNAESLITYEQTVQKLSIVKWLALLQNHHKDINEQKSYLQVEFTKKSREKRKTRGNV